MGYDGTKWDSVGGSALEEALTIAIMSLWKRTKSRRTINDC
jgi:hypothetical protein